MAPHRRRIVADTPWPHGVDGATPIVVTDFRLILGVGTGPARRCPRFMTTNDPAWSLDGDDRLTAGCQRGGDVTLQSANSSPDAHSYGPVRGPASHSDRGRFGTRRRGLPASGFC
jgi:hypothetical protein